MTQIGSGRRYDHHKRKSKRRKGAKKNKTGKKRSRIQVGGGTSPCKVCATFMDGRSIGIIKTHFWSMNFP